LKIINGGFLNICVYVIVEMNVKLLAKILKVAIPKVVDACAKEVI
jgi:hypothetical protein